MHLESLRGGDENILELDSGASEHLCDLKKKQQPYLYTLKGWILWYMNYISI